MIKLLARKKSRDYILSLFVFLLLSGLLYSAEIQCQWDGVERIVAVADIHGDYHHFERILKGISVINDELDWIGGKTHLVQMGDVMDRGPMAKQVFELLSKLEKQAETAGGKVHVLIGNHEESNIVGIAWMFPGYVTNEQFVSFLPEGYRNSLEKKFEKKFIQSGDSNPTLEEELNKFWEKTRNENRAAREEYHRNFYKMFGKWLLTKNAVIKINDIVFTHGGISEEFSTWDMKKINDVLRNELKWLYRGIPVEPEPRIANQPDAPHWFRDLILSEEEDLAEDVKRIMGNLEATYMVVGHTVRTQAVIESRKLDRFQGKIWGIDTGISSYYYGVLSALVIEKGKFKVWWGDDEN